MKQNKEHRLITLWQLIKALRLLVSHKPHKKVLYKEPTKADLERKYRLDIR